jgi:hypothetical protein
MFVAIMDTPIMVEGQSIRVAGPFPSLSAVQIWAAKYSADNNYTFPEPIKATTLYIPEKNERVPVVETLPDEERVEAVPPVVNTFTPKEIKEPAAPTRPVLTLPAVKRGEIQHDKDGRMILRPVTVAQYEAAWANGQGYCVACGDKHPVEIDAIFVECPTCGKPWLMGAMALGENGYVLEATSFVQQRSASAKARTTRGH